MQKIGDNALKGLLQMLSAEHREDREEKHSMNWIRVNLA